MTDAELRKLYESRNAALAVIKGANFGLFLCDMNAKERAENDCASEAFRASDKAITAELIRRRKPAVLGEITLHLTSDRLNFIALKTGTLRFATIGSMQGCSKSMLLDYERAFGKAVGRPAAPSGIPLLDGLDLGNAQPRRSTRRYA